jgi:hypothetical protein
MQLMSQSAEHRAQDRRDRFSRPADLDVNQPDRLIGLKVNCLRWSVSDDLPEPAGSVGLPKLAPTLGRGSSFRGLFPIASGGPTYLT